MQDLLRNYELSWINYKLYNNCCQRLDIKFDDLWIILN